MLEKTQSFLLNLFPCEDGVLPFDRELLFESCAAWMADRLFALGPVTVLSPHQGAYGRSETVITGSYDNPVQALRDNLDLLDCETAIVCDAPAPELVEKDYGELEFMHVAQNAALTELVADHQESGMRSLHLMAFDVPKLRRALQKSEAPTLLQLALEMKRNGFKLSTISTHHGRAVTTAEEAYETQRLLQRRINLALLNKGVQFLDLDHVYVSRDSAVGAGCTLLPGTIIRGGSQVEAGCTIGPNTLLDQAVIGPGTTVNSSQVLESSVGEKSTVGPFAYIRPGCQVGAGARIGDFVELKKSSIGDGTKVSHLTYIGDAKVGERVNFGCGTVVVNYDGFGKYETRIGDDAFIGCNTNLVAPVSVGRGAFTAAGTTVTEDVPDDALAIGRARQENRADWAARNREKKGGQAQ